MPRTTKLSVSLGRTVGLPNYGSLRVDETEEIELLPGDDPAVAERELHSRVYQRLMRTLDAVLPK